MGQSTLSVVAADTPDGLGGDVVDEQIASLAPWSHNLLLPSGHETAPDHPRGNFPRSKWGTLASAIPLDLTGWTALDTGCNAGFYTFELAKRGATVLGSDADERYLRQARWAARAFGLQDRVLFERRGAYDLARSDERFDIVLALGGLDHLRHPLLALDILAAKAERLFVLQTLSLPGEDDLHAPVDLRVDESDTMLQLGWPKLAFIERRYEGDATSWWAPNHACVGAMLRSAGLEVVARPSRELYVCRPRGVPEAVRREVDAATGGDYRDASSSQASP